MRQLYGVIRNCDENGVSSHGNIADEKFVDQRRALLVLGQFKMSWLSIYKKIQQNVAPLESADKRKQKTEVWAREMGWV